MVAGLATPIDTTAFYQACLNAVSSDKSRRFSAADGACPQGAGGYDAVASKGRRRPPRSDLRSEDWVLPSVKRRKLVATARDIIRNYTTAAWMIRCHLDYVSRFNFQPRTGNDDLNRQLIAVVRQASRKGRFEASGRFNRSVGMRITEARSVLDGDFFWIKLGKGVTAGQIQMLEGDRVLTPPGGVPTALPYKPTDFVHGIAVDPDTGRMKAVCVCKRQRDGVFAAEWGGGLGGYIFERVIPAENVWQHACWDTTYRVDQVRGISPLAPALNSLEDIYEGVDLAFAKAKVAQMFGLIFYRQAIEQSEGWAGRKGSTYVGDDSADGVPDGGIQEGNGSGNSGQIIPPAEDEDDARYDVDPGAGPFKMELQENDRAEFLQTNTPETELLHFMQFVTDLAIKCVDIPYSFYDSSKANYYGQKADIQKYENSARSKRERNQDLLCDWVAWQCQFAVMDGRLTLPAGMTTIADIGLDPEWWIPTAMPWIDKLRDIKADQLAIAGGQDSKVRAARRAGNDYYELAGEEMDAEAWTITERKRRGLPELPIGSADEQRQTTTVTDDQVVKNDDNQSRPKRPVRRFSDAPVDVAADAILVATEPRME